MRNAGPKRIFCLFAACMLCLLNVLPISAADPDGVRAKVSVHVDGSKEPVTVGLYLNGELLSSVDVTEDGVLETPEYLDAGDDLYEVRLAGTKVPDPTVYKFRVCAVYGESGLTTESFAYQDGSDGKVDVCTFTISSKQTEKPLDSGSAPKTGLISHAGFFFLLALIFGVLGIFSIRQKWSAKQ